MSEERVILTPEQAEAMLPDCENIHTFRQTSMGIILGCDNTRQYILQAFKTYPPELSGAGATAMNHGIVYKDDMGYCFVETKEFGPEKPKERS